MAGDHVGHVRRHDMDGRHGKDCRRGLGGHDLRSRRNHRPPEHNRRRHHPRHRILRHQTGERTEPDGRDARGHRTVGPPPPRPVGHRDHTGRVPHDGSDDRPTAPDGMERQPRRGRVRGRPARPRPAPGQPHAERGRARAAPLRVLPGGQRLRPHGLLLASKPAGTVRRDDIQTPAIRRPEYAGHDHQPQRGHEGILPRQDHERRRTAHPKPRLPGRIPVLARTRRRTRRPRHDRPRHAQRTAQTGTGAEAAAEPERRPARPGLGRVHRPGRHLDPPGPPRLTDASTPPAGADRTVRRSRGRDAGTAGTGARDHGHETGLAERVGGEQARAHLYIACEGRTRLAEDDRRTPPAAPSSTDRT